MFEYERNVLHSP